MRDVNRRLAIAACIVFLIALAIVVHITALSGWWLNDDPAILVESVREPALSILFSPAEYGHLSTITFTPLLLLSFKLDLLLHGLTPWFFYAHQLASMIVAALLFFLLLRRYVSDVYAAAGAGVLLTSWVAVYAVRTLMIRHYVEGLLFALGALLAWSYGRRGLIVGSALYLLAALSKEVYAPIPLFLICQQRYAGRTWREIARDLIPPSIAAAIFLIWRWFMTGLTGGYASAAMHGHFSPIGAALWNGVTGPAPWWAQIVWAICIAFVFAAFLVRTRFRGAGFLAATAVVVALPIIPLAGRFDIRYSFAFVAFGIAALTIACGTIGRRWAIDLMLLLVVTTTFTAFPQRRYYETVTRNGMAQEGRYVWDKPAGAPALFAASPAWYLESLAWLRGWEHRGAAPRFVFSQWAIAAGAVDPNRAVAIASNGQPVPLASCSNFGTPEEWRRERQLYDPASPLVVDFALRNHVAEWHLGPPGGEFVFLSDPDFYPTPIPAEGKQRVPEGRGKQYFRIVRTAAGGRWTMSPTLPVPEAGATRFVRPRR